MKYNGNHDGRALTIYRDLEDDEILEDTDTEDTGTTLEVKKRNDLEEKRDSTNTDAGTKEDPYKGTQPPLAEQAEIIKETLKTLEALLETAPEESRTWGRASVKMIQLHIQNQNEEIAKLRVKLQVEETRHTNHTKDKNTQSWASTPTRQGSPVNKWSQGNPFKTPQAVHLNATTSAIQPGDSRRQRQLLIRIKDEKERKRIGETAEEILKELKNTQRQKQDIAQLESTRRLHSGDLLVQTTTVEARERLEKDTTWLTKRYTSAKVIRKAYPVIVHGMRVASVNTHAWLEAKERFKQNNQRLHPNLEITGMRWLSNTHKIKTHSSLVLDLSILRVPIVNPSDLVGVRVFALFLFGETDG